MFSESEVRFLREYATTSNSIRPIQDLRELGCPPHIFARVLEARAKKIGRPFEQFQAEEMLEKVRATPVASADPDLEAQIRGARFF